MRCYVIETLKWNKKYKNKFLRVILKERKENKQTYQLHCTIFHVPLKVFYPTCIYKSFIKNSHLTEEILKSLIDSE